MGKTPFKLAAANIAGVFLKVDQRNGKIWTAEGHTFDKWPDTIEVNGISYHLNEHGMDGEFPWAYYGEERFTVAS
jgi:hypothetical protein